MTLDHLNLPYFNPSKVVVLADIHINSSLSESFERARLKSLSISVLRQSLHSSIVLAGDTFDRNTPSLIDIKIFYDFIKDLKASFYGKEILVINGNHDNQTFEYLPETSFKYIKISTVVNNNYMLVPWTQLKPLANLLESKQFPNLTLISHARCTIAPYITEEVSIKLLSESFRQVILGDIHTQPTLPYENVKYVTSPSSIHFSTPIKDAHGCLYIHKLYKDEENTEGVFEYGFRSFSIPSKHLIVVEDFQEAKSILLKGSKRHFLKVRFKGTAEEIRELSKIPSQNILKDLSLVHDSVGKVLEAENSLQTFLQNKTSVSEYAFRYFKETLKINENTLITLKQSYEQLRTSKGVHKK